MMQVIHKRLRMSSKVADGHVLTDVKCKHCWWHKTYNWQNRSSLQTAGCDNICGASMYADSQVQVLWLTPHHKIYVSALQDTARMRQILQTFTQLFICRGKHLCNCALLSVLYKWYFQNPLPTVHRSRNHCYVDPGCWQNIPKLYLQPERLWNPSIHRTSPLLRHKKNKMQKRKAEYEVIKIVFTGNKLILAVNHVLLLV